MIPICLIFNLKNRHYKQPSTNAVDGVLASVSCEAWSTPTCSRLLQPKTI